MADLHKIPPCICVLPYYGPNYWDWRCRACSGRIVGFRARLKARKALRKHEH